MDVNDQRDFAEESANRAEMEREALAELEVERAETRRLWIEEDLASRVECDIFCTCIYCIPGA